MVKRLRSGGSGVTLVALCCPNANLMSTTSLKLTEALKKRVLAEAERKNISPHAFMVGAIEQAALAAEHRAAFIAEAIDAKEDMMMSGQGFDADEVHAYITARIAGEDPPRPLARNWRR